MAIKVSGTIVVDDSRNVSNVANVCATTYYGDASKLTNVPSKSVVQYSTLHSGSGNVCIGQAVSCVCAGYVTKTVGDPNVKTITTAYNETCNCCVLYHTRWCLGPVGSPYCYSTLAACSHSKGYNVHLRTGKCKFTSIALTSPWGYNCLGPWLCTDCYWASCQCFVSSWGAPSPSNYCLPCYLISNYIIDYNNECVCQTANTYYAAFQECSTCKQCNDFNSYSLMKEMYGLPFEIGYNACCNYYCSGPCYPTYVSPAGCLYIGTQLGGCAICNGYATSGRPAFAPGLINHWSMCLKSCTGNKYYLAIPLGVGGCVPAACPSYCAYTYVSYCGNNSCNGYPIAWGLFSFCTCGANNDELNLSTACLQKNFDSSWQVGYVSKNKRFMYGEKTKINYCGSCTSNWAGCGYLYVNEINDSFSLCPAAGKITGSDRVIRHGWSCSGLTSAVCSLEENPWRFWPRSEDSNGWVIATQPIACSIVYCDACCTRCVCTTYNALKIMAFKPTGTGTGITSNVLCLCHNSLNNGGICAGYWRPCNGVTTCAGCCYCPGGISISGLQYFAGWNCASTLSCFNYTGCWYTFDHSDGISSYSAVNSFCSGYFGKPSYMYRYQQSYTSTTTTCNRGTLPQANLFDVRSCGSGTCSIMNLTTFWTGGEPCSCLLYAGGSYCHCYLTGPGAYVCLCVNNSTCTLAFLGCSGFTDLSSNLYYSPTSAWSSALRMNSLGSPCDLFNDVDNARTYTGSQGRGSRGSSGGEYAACPGSGIYPYRNSCDYCNACMTTGGAGCGVLERTYCLLAGCDSPFGYSKNALNIDPLAWDWVSPSTFDLGNYTDTETNLYVPYQYAPGCTVCGGSYSSAPSISCTSGYTMFTYCIGSGGHANIILSI